MSMRNTFIALPLVKGAYMII